VNPRILILVLMVSAACAQGVPQEGAPVQMAPVTVKAGPLGSIGIRCNLDVGMFAFISDSARIRALVIADVTKDSPGERAGLRAQDHILAIDGIQITDYTISSLKEIGHREKGDTIDLVVLTPGAMTSRTVHVTFGARRPAPKGS
jgi:C-terminal processing protease CtpA/Prc